LCGSKLDFSFLFVVVILFLHLVELSTSFGENLCNENNLTGPSKNDVPKSIEALYLGAGASKLLRYPVTLKTPLSHLQKDSKTSCDEIQHFDIFPQPWHHFLTAQFVRSENPLWGCPKIGDQRFDVNHWNEFMEVFIEKSRDVIYEDLPSETKKLF
jgi:hypothetical protein